MTRSTLGLLRSIFAVTNSQAFLFVFFFEFFDVSFRFYLYRFSSRLFVGRLLLAALRYHPSFTIILCAHLTKRVCNLKWKRTNTHRFASSKRSFLLLFFLHFIFVSFRLSVFLLPSPSRRTQNGKMRKVCV